MQKKYIDLRLGRNLARSLFEYYKQINLIPAPIKTIDGRSKHSKKKSKKNQIKHLRPKPTRPKPTRHLLEPRIIMPSILETQFNDDIPGQNKNQQELLSTKILKRHKDNSKSVYHLDEMLDEPMFSFTKPMTSSPTPKLAIIDLNNTIRSGLKNGYPKITYRSKSGVEERRSAKKKRLEKNKPLINKIEIFTSDDDYIDIE